MIRIFHHYDADGYAAAAVIIRMYMEYAYYGDHFYTLPIFIVNRDKEIKTYSCKHGYPFDFSEVDPEKDMVYIVDYSFSNKKDIQRVINLNNEFKKHNKSIIWIDHHKSSQDIIDEYPEIKELADNGLIVPDNICAGVSLAWIYCEQMVKRLLPSHKVIEHIKEHATDISDYYNMPSWVYLTDISDRFVEDDPNFITGREFTFGALNMDGGLKEVFLSKNSPFSNVDSAELDYTEKIIEYGKICRKFQAKSNRYIVKGQSFQVYMENDWSGTGDNVRLNILAVNADGSSEVFGEDVTKFDAVVLFIYNGAAWEYSIFSHKSKLYPVNNVAKYYLNKFGITGGGHDHAAGWTAPCNIFETEFVEHVQYKNIKWK